MKHEQVIVKAILAGICVGIAGLVYLSVPNKILGAILFSFALLMIVSRSYYLYTGKIGYLLPLNKAYGIVLLKTLLGNLLGLLIVAVLFRLSGFDHIIQYSNELFLTKISKAWYETIVLAILCGIVMFIAVDSYKKLSNELTRTLIVILCVVIFILASFEHSIANLFYLLLSGAWSLNAVLYIGLMLIGNAIGAVGFAFLEQHTQCKKEKQTIQEQQ